MGEGEINHSFVVGSFTVYPEHNTLGFGEETFAIEPLVMDVLCCLAKRPNQVVSRDELISHVWLMNAGTDESLTRAISLLRGIFRNDQTCADYIKTIWKRGYQLTASVEDQNPPSHRLRVSSRLLDPLPAKPDYSVGVLGFENMSGSQSDRFLADGITRDLTTMLGRVPRLHVAAYNSATLFHNGSASIAEISEQLGVRYIVSGTLTCKGGRISIRLSLMDSASNEQVWADKINVGVADFYAAEDKIVLDISTAMSSALQLSFARSPQLDRRFEIGAYKLVQRAEALRQNYNATTATQIITLLEKALEINPDDAAVHAALAVQHTQNIVSNFAGTPADSSVRARQHVDTAMRLSPQDPEVLAAAGIAATMMGNARRAVRHLTRSVELNPNNPHTLAVLGWQYCWLNKDIAGKEMIERAEQRAPHNPRFAVWAHYRGHCEIRLGRIEQAILAYQDCADRNPQYSLNLVTLAMAQAWAGKEQDARETIDRLLPLAPHYTVDDYAKLATYMIYWFDSQAARDQSIDALRRVWPQEKQSLALP